MKIWLRVSSLAPCSWSFVWKYLNKAFAQEGHEVSPDPFSKPSTWKEEEIVELWWGDPSNWVWSNHKPMLRVGIALSEARSLLARGREYAIENLNRCHCLICPSQHAAIAYQEAPIDIPIYIVFFGVDIEEFKPVERKWDGTLKLLHLGNIQYRKGSWLVCEAFIEAFNSSHDVSLTMACFVKGSPMFASLKDEYSSHPQIKFIGEMFETSYELYAQHHILVSSQLAEGFGLCIPEAMATKMPCIVSRCSAPTEFFSNKFGWWIEMSELYSPVSWCLHETGGFWRLPDVHDLSVKMRLAYENRSECQEKGQLGSNYVIQKMTWNHTAKGIAKILEQIIRG